LIFHLKEYKLIKQLDKIMEDNNYRRVSWLIYYLQKMIKI
jgi:hypothetical protein